MNQNQEDSPVEKWQILSSKKVYQTKRYPVDSVDFMRPGNELWKDVFIRREPDAVIILALTIDHKVVLLKHFRPGPDEVITELPAGDIDKGEQPLTAGLRELLEETGFQGEDYAVIGSSYRDAYSTGKFFFVVVKGCFREKNPNCHQGLRSVELVSVDEFKRLLFAQTMTNSECGFRGLHYLKML